VCERVGPSSSSIQEVVAAGEDDEHEGRAEEDEEDAATEGDEEDAADGPD